MAGSHLGGGNWRPQPRRGRSKGRSRGRGFKPYKPPANPPPGSYDPALDAQERAGARGLFDTQQDTDTGNTRTWSDLITGDQDIKRERDEGLSDIMRRRGQEKEDFTWNTGQLDRNYAQLANRQTQGSRQAGTAQGGALRRQLAKRTENRAIDQRPLDTGFSRFNEQSGIDETRTKEGADRQLGKLWSTGQRDLQDRNSFALPRAEREQSYFGQDIAQQRWYQAKGSGYDPYQDAPANEFSKHGLTYQVGNAKAPLHKRTYTLPTGKRLSRKGFVGYVKKRR